MPEEPCNKCGHRTGILRAPGKVFCYSCQDCSDFLNQMRKHKHDKTGEEYKRMELEKEAIRLYPGGAPAYNKAQALALKRKSTSNSEGSATRTNSKKRATPAEDERVTTESSTRKRQKKQSTEREEAKQGTERTPTDSRADKAREESKTPLEMSKWFLKYLGSCLAVGTTDRQERINLRVMVSYMTGYMAATGASGMSIAQMLTASIQQRYMNSASVDQRVKAATFLKWFGHFSESLNEFSSAGQLTRMAQGARKKASKQQAINRRSGQSRDKTKEWRESDFEQLRDKTLAGSTKFFASVLPQLKGLCNGDVKFVNNGLTAKQRHELAAHPVVVANMDMKPMRGCVAASLTIPQLQQLCESDRKVVVVEQRKASVKDKYVPLLAASEGFGREMTKWLKFGRPTLQRQGMSSLDPIVLGAMAIRQKDVDAAWKFMNQRQSDYEILLQENDMYKPTGNPRRMQTYMHLFGAELKFDENFINQQAKKNTSKGKVEHRHTHTHTHTHTHQLSLSHTHTRTQTRTHTHAHTHTRAHT
jgi:hypothetical protein